MNMFSGMKGEALSKAELNKAIAIFLCGPNKSCDHVMDHYVPLYDGDRECGSTLACSKCGETAFNMDMWI